MELQLELVVIDTIAACAGYPRAGDENNSAAAQAVMNVLKVIAETLGCFVLGVDHFGKNVKSGTRGSGAKESAADVVLACLATKSSMAASRTQGWPCGRTGAANRARNSHSPRALWRRRNLTKRGSGHHDGGGLAAEYARR